MIWQFDELGTVAPRHLLGQGSIDEGVADDHFVIEFFRKIRRRRGAAEADDDRTQMTRSFAELDQDLGQVLKNLGFRSLLVRKIFISQVTADQENHLHYEDAHRVYALLLLEQALGEAVGDNQVAAGLYPGLGAAELGEQVLRFLIQFDIFVICHAIHCPCSRKPAALQAAPVNCNSPPEFLRDQVSAFRMDRCA